MGYNKKQFIKCNDKKVLHKVKKQWVVLSLSMLALLGGGVAAEHVSAHADNTNELRDRINAVMKNQPASPRAQSGQFHQSAAIRDQANVLHNRILLNAAQNDKKQDQTRLQDAQRDHGANVSQSTDQVKQTNNRTDGRQLVAEQSDNTKLDNQAQTNLHKNSSRVDQQNNSVHNVMRVNHAPMVTDDGDGSTSTKKDIVDFVLSGKDIPADYSGKTGLVGSDKSDYTGPSNGNYTFNGNSTEDKNNNMIPKLPYGFKIAGSSNQTQTIPYDGSIHKINVVPVSTPVSIKYVDASDSDPNGKSPLGGTSLGKTTVNFYYNDNEHGTKQMTVSDLEKSSKFPSYSSGNKNKKYEIYPPSERSVTINKDGSTVIPVAKQGVLATGLWNMSNQNSARFKVVVGSDLSNQDDPVSQNFKPDNSDNTLVFTKKGPLDLNSWSNAGYVDTQKVKHRVFSADANHDDGNSSYPNALNRNSIHHIKFNSGVTIQLPAGTSQDKGLPAGAKSDSGLFRGMHNLIDIKQSDSSGHNHYADGSEFDAKNAQHLSAMFESDDHLQELNLSYMKETSDVTVTSDMFAGDKKLSDLTLPASGFGILKNIAGMFSSDQSLRGNAGGTRANAIVNSSDSNYNPIKKNNPIKKSSSDLHNLSRMKVSQVSDMDSVFESDTNLRGLNLSKWQDNNLSDMDAMFANDKNLEYLDIQGLTNQKMIGGAISDFQNDFANSSDNKYAVILNREMALGPDSLLDGNWYSPDYESDPELFSPRQIDQYGANLGPNASATWIKLPNNKNAWTNKTEQVGLYNQVGSYLGSRTVVIPQKDNSGNYLVSVSDQIRGQSIPAGYRLPNKNQPLSDYVNGNLIKTINDTTVGYDEYNYHPKVYLLGYSDTQSLPVYVEFNDTADGHQAGVPQKMYIQVSGYYGDTNDSVPVNSWQPGPGTKYQFDPNPSKSFHVYNGQIHYNMLNHGNSYMPNDNANWNIASNDQHPIPLLYYNNKSNIVLRLIYVNQSGQQIGCSDNISGAYNEQVNVTDPNDNGMKIPDGYQLVGGSSNVNASGSNQGNSDEGVYGKEQDTIYTLTDKKRTVYLHVEGNSANQSDFVKVHRVMINGNGHITTDTEKVALEDLNGNGNPITHKVYNKIHDGDEIELNPSDSQIKPAGNYSVDYSRDSVQFIDVGDHNQVNPSEVTFYYQSTTNSGAPIAIRYTASDGRGNDHAVGSIQVLQGDIGKPVMVDSSHVNGPGQIELPKGYELEQHQDRRGNIKTFSDTLYYTNSPQIMDVKVQGKTYQGYFTITRSYGNKSNTYKIDINGQVGESFTVSPYGFGSDKIMSNISYSSDGTHYKLSNNREYNVPSDYHATQNDSDITVYINSDGKLSRSNATYNYESNKMGQTSLATIRIHYITPDSDGSITFNNEPNKKYRELDRESDSGTSDDQFDLTPYLDDIPESTSQYYDVGDIASPSDVVDNNNKIIGNSQYSGISNKHAHKDRAPDYVWKYGASNAPSDVYIKVHQNGYNGNQPIIID